jgi:ATP-dependent Lon protease
MPDLGLFPLQLVVFPGERLPLHIFEPRYLELIAECRERDEEFGILLADEADIHEVGTRAAVVEVLEQLPDGRLNIIVEGRERFQVTRLTTGRSFRTAAVEPFLDEPDPADPAAAANALRLLQALATAAGVEVDLPQPDSPTLSFEVAARVELALDDEQELLELRSERVRLDRLAELLAEAADQTRLAREAHERAHTNGKLPHPPPLP